MTTSIVHGVEDAFDEGEFRGTVDLKIVGDIVAVVTCDMLLEELVVR